MTTTTPLGLWRTIIAVSLIAAAFGPSSAVAQESAADARSGLTSGRTLPILLRSAKLTAEQRVQVQSILASHRPGVRALIRDLRQAQDDLADKLLAAGQPQLAELQPQLSKISQLRDRLLHESAQVTIEIRALLTPEQVARAGLVKDKLRQLRSEVDQLLQSSEP
jgi:Spy/CpxP family protein refolding chaperone